MTPATGAYVGKALHMVTTRTHAWRHAGTPIAATWCQASCVTRNTPQGDRCFAVTMCSARGALAMGRGMADGAGAGGSRPVVAALGESVMQE